MRIVVLDGYTLNPGDLSWSELEALGEAQIYDRTPAAQVADRGAGAQILLTNKTPISGADMERLPELRYIGVLATGYNVIDIEAAKRLGITVCNVPAYGTSSVAQMTFALLLELCHRVQRHSDSVMAGRWSANPDFCFWDYPQVELYGKTMAILGMGEIGSRVADLAESFGMEIIAYSRRRTDQSARPRFRWVELPQLFAEADVLSVHCPLTPETNALINAGKLRLMKPSAFLLNTSRGPIIQEADLAAALREGRLAGAALDVLSVEPPPREHPLYGLPNCIITPHISWATREARSRLMQQVVANLKAFLSGKPLHVVV